MSAVQGKRIMYITTRVDVRCHWTIQRHTEHGTEKTKSLKSCIGEAHKHPLCKGYQLTPHKGGGQDSYTTRMFICKCSEERQDKRIRLI